jgi:hypothetical protein
MEPNRSVAGPASLSTAEARIGSRVPCAAGLSAWRRPASGGRSTARWTIASHANDVGTVRAGSKTEAFKKAVKAPVCIPLSGRTVEFDAAAQGTAGC